MSRERSQAEQRVHRARSTDGTEIAGRVQGTGPPLVFFHGGLTDGDRAWAEMIPSVSDQFTCYLPSMRGTGLSEDHDDQRPERHIEDLTAYINSIGEPVGLVGHSTGGYYGIGAIEHGADVWAMATYEPPVFKMWEEGEDAERFEQALIAMAEAANDGRLAEGARSFLSAVSNEHEMAQLAEKGVFEEVAQYVPSLLQVLAQAEETKIPDPNEPSQLSRVTIPVLLLYGSQSTTAHKNSVWYLAEHLPDTEVREIPAIGHMAPEIEPEPVSDVMVEFFSQQLTLR